MESITKLSEKIKTLKNAKIILQDEYENSEFHKKKEANPQDIVPSSPEDKEIYKLLNAIHQIESHIKKLQDKQYKILQKSD
jgi:hypothetical protein